MRPVLNESRERLRGETIHSLVVRAEGERQRRSGQQIQGMKTVHVRPRRSASGAQL